MFSAFNKSILLFVVIIVVFSNVNASMPSVRTDTALVKPRPGQLSLTTRFNSSSMFYFTGVAWDNRPTFDVKFFYENNGWGGLIFKSFELTGRSTAINYALVVLHKRFYLGKKWMISPQIGAQLNQNASLADGTSDFLTNLAISYKLNPNFTISNDAVFQNLILTNRPNWTNRLKLSFQSSNFTAAAMIWDRNEVLGNPGYTNGGIELGYGGIKLSPTMSLLLGVQSVVVFQADTPRKNGLLFSVGVGI